MLITIYLFTGEIYYVNIKKEQTDKGTKRMNNELIHFNYDAALPYAKEDFIHACGLGKKNHLYEELMNEALMVLRNGRDGLNLAAVVTSLGKDAFYGDSITIKDISFKCTAFEQIPKENLLDIYAYLLTAGSCSFPKQNLMEQYYADLWGSAFLKSAGILLRNHLAREISLLYPHSYLSFSLGPGSYGMKGEKLLDMVKTLDSDLIGVSADEDGKIKPIKSSGGFFVAVCDKSKLPSEKCKNCIGREEGCMFCGGNNLIPKREECLLLLKQYKTPAHVVRHCHKVNEVALIIANALIKKGYDMNLDLLEAAALLHDIARTHENHGAKGAEIALKHGFSEVADLIKCHMFYVTDPFKKDITEQDILCLSDRMVKEDKYVGIEKRMQAVLDKYKDDPLVVSRIRQRMRENIRFRNRVEQVIGKAMDELLG